MTRSKSIAIIGAGPAGLAAAETLARLGHRVSVYDRMPSVGRKFLIAGRGGLNLTNSEPLEDFLGRYGAHRTKLEPSITAYPPDLLVRWAEELGQPTFTGSSGRVFPTAMKASPLLRAWLRRLTELGIEIHTRHTWNAWTQKGALRFATPKGEISVTPDATLLALGGASWPRLGADGSWTEILQSSGIHVTPLAPSNAAARVAWSAHLLSKFEGAALKRVAATFGGETHRGDLVITRKGLEGGAIYALSPSLRDATAHTSPVTLFIDLKPDATREALAQRLGAGAAKQSTANRLRKSVSLDAAAISLMHEVNRDLPQDPHALAAIIKAVPVNVMGVDGLDRAISTAGGIALDGLDENFMLKARPGTFAAGEMLDWEAPTGGYLLQGCFATGVAAAHGIIGWLEPSGENTCASRPVLLTGATS